MPGLLPSDDAAEIEWLAFEQSGVFTVRQAVALVGSSAVRSLVRSGCWRPICRGVVLTSNGRLTAAQQLWVAVLAAGPGALLAGPTAAAEGGVRGLPRDRLHLLLPAQRRGGCVTSRLPMDMPTVVLHRTTVLPREHVQVGRPPRTTVARAVVDAAGWARSAGEAQLALAAACQQRRVLPEEISRVLDVLPRAPRRRLIRHTVSDLAGGAEALSEINLVRLCRRYRLPPPRLQQRRTDAAGRVRWLDAYWPQAGLHVEIDGAHHMDAREWAADMARQNDVWITGERILRFPAWLVRSHPEQVAETLRRALAAG